MRPEIFRESIELVSLSIEVLAVAIIVGAILYGIGRGVFYRAKKAEDTYALFKERIGKGLLLGLEYLIAADIIRTVALDPTLRSITVLGLLVMIRTFLSWSIVVEIEGRWPWKGRAETNRQK
jgi:uncharacterized membrane protein